MSFGVNRTDLRQRLQGGEDVKTPPMERGADQLRGRFLSSGVSAGDFRAGLVTWNPPSIRFFGEVELTHSLGRVPQGMFMVRENLKLGWSIPDAQRAKWDTTKIFILVDELHHWDVVTATLANATTNVDVVLNRPRADNANVYTASHFSAAAGAPSDFEPVVQTQTNSNAAGETIGFRLAYSGGTTETFSLLLQVHAWTALRPQDTFVWQVI